MFDLGDELIFGSHRIPWLIWIQLLVMLLLILLLYHFSIFAFRLDLSSNATAASPSSALLASNSESSRHRPLPNAATKVGESHSIKGDTGTTASRRRVRSEDLQENREGSSSATDGTDASVLERCNHPCHYLALAKQAFLRCLGLDPFSADSANTRQRKEE